MSFLFSFSFPIQTSNRLSNHQLKRSLNLKFNMTNITNPTNACNSLLCLFPKTTYHMDFYLYIPNGSTTNSSLLDFSLTYMKENPQITHRFFSGCQMPPSIKACQPIHSQQESFLSHGHPSFQKNPMLITP